MIFNLGGDLWPNGVVPFKISQHLPHKLKVIIVNAIKYWQQKTNIKFIELTNSNIHQYTDYIYFRSSLTSHSSSYVGRQGGAQEVNISLHCNKMNIVHEIGHALGLWHEQSRTDRDNFVRIIWQNIRIGHEYNFNQHLTDGKDIGIYDYHSIMHYGSYAYSKNGQKTIIPLIHGIKIGQRKHLSQKDILAINLMYPSNL